MFPCPVSLSGPSFQQLQALKNPEYVTVGGTVTLSCLFSSGNLGDGNYPGWVQQKDGAVPRLVLYNTVSKPSDIPARFSGSRSGNTMSLTITGALGEDESDFYCYVWTGSACTITHSDGEVGQKLPSFLCMEVFQQSLAGRLTGIYQSFGQPK